MYIEVITQGRETCYLIVKIAGAQWLQRHNVEINARDLQKFVFFQFTLRWTSLGIWIAFAALAYRDSFYRKDELLNLHLATALSAVFLAAAVAIIITLVYFVIRVAQAQQHW